MTPDINTSQRVDTWLAALAPPQDAPADVAAGFAKVLARISEPQFRGEDGISWFESLLRNAREPRLYSLGIHAGVFTLLIFGAANPVVQKVVRQQFVLVAPSLRVFVPEAPPKANATQGGGGGGAREPLPVSAGQMPGPALKQFVPPQIADHTPLLAMNPSILAPPDTPLPPSSLNNWGDPLAKLMNASNGNGTGGGIGNGAGSGLGPGHGSGYGSGEGGGIAGGVFRAGGGVSAPVVLAKVDPEYSEEARKAKYSGTVLLSVIVDAEGRARDVRVTKSLGLGLDEKAVEAVLKWKFRAGMRNGTAVNVRALIEVNFRLL